jgi:ribosomal protein S18 acetylase RimI-like enzyme
MNEITYRRATLDDTKALCELSVEFERYNKENSTRPHEHFFGDWENSFIEEVVESLTMENACVFLALVDGQPVGYICARLCKGCHAFIVEELFVKSKYSKLGIGGKLLDLAITEGRGFGYDIKVEVFDWNQSAKDYYLKKGFFVESLVLKLSP